MGTEIDINRLVVDFVQSNLEHAVDFASSKMKGARNVVRSNLERTYNNYLTRILTRYSKAKSFFVRSEPVPLYDFFVPLDLANQKRRLKKATAEDVADVASCSIVIGSGGSGKTMFMRHLLISTIRSRLKTPVFFELRQLNQGDDSLRTSLLGTLQANALDVDEDYLELALKAGHLSLMLDGFDEVEHSRRKRVAQQIQNLAERYPKNWFIMSSRPDSELEGWVAFTQFTVQPLDLESAIELVSRLPVDDPLKTKFIADLRDGLFEKHKSFLSNPLLLSIMLLTYTDIAHIPDKLSIFYNQAYESLFQKHDALKSGFQRDRRSGLDIQDFARAFAAFCVQSYDKREFSFSRTRALELLERGRTISQLQYEPDALLEDAVQAVCLLVEDGIELTFAHRSFQEYFVARFIYSSPPEIKAQLVKRFGPTVQSDSVIGLLHELDPYSVERYYILPMLSALRKRLQLKRSVGMSHYQRYVQMVYSRFTIATREEENEQLMATIEDLPVYLVLRFAHQRYVDSADRPWNDGDRAAIISLRDTFKQQFGASATVPARDISIRSSFLRALSGVRGNWGIAYLRQAFEVERLIKERHRATQNSLDQILG